MLAAVMAALALTAGTHGGSAAEWNCTNQVEVWCDDKSCAARPVDETTPLSVSVDTDGGFSVCAYSGCWEGTARHFRKEGRLLLTAEDVPFTSGAPGLAVPVTLLIIENDGTGFVRVGGLATPLICRRAAPD